MRMHAAPRWLVFLVLLGLAVGAGVAPGVWGAACALVLAAFLSWLLFLAWPRLKPTARVLRIAVITALLAAAVAKIAIG